MGSPGNSRVSEELVEMKTGECRALGKWTLGRGRFYSRKPVMIKELEKNSSKIQVT